MTALTGLLDRYRPLREGEGAGNGGGAPAPGGAKPAPAPGGKAAADNQPGAQPYYPAGLADHFKGSDDRATIDALHTAYNGARESLNKVPKPPAKPDDYKLVLEEKLAAKIGDLSADPVMKEARKFAHAHGMHADQFQGFMADMLTVMTDVGAYAPQPSDDQLAAMLIDRKVPEAQKPDAMKGAHERITNARAWVDGHRNAAAFNDAEKAEMLLMTQTPGGLQLIEKMMAGTINNPVATGGTGTQQQSMKDVINSRLRDPRNIPGRVEYDRNFAQETRRMQRQHFG